MTLDPKDAETIEEFFSNLELNDKEHEDNHNPEDTSNDRSSN